MGYSMTKTIINQTKNKELATKKNYVLVQMTGFGVARDAEDSLEVFYFF